MDFIFVLPYLYTVILMASSGNKELLSGKQLNYGVAVCDDYILFVYIVLVLFSKQLNMKFVVSTLRFMFIY